MNNVFIRKAPELDIKQHKSLYNMFKYIFHLSRNKKKVFGK